MFPYRRWILAVASLVLMTSIAVVPTVAEVLDPPTFTIDDPGTAKQPLVIAASATGAPGGFTIWWMTEDEFIANGSQWYPSGDPRQGEAYFWGVPTLNVFVGESSTFVLAPSSHITIELGDIADESGLTSTAIGELQWSTTYVFRAMANGADGSDPSPWSQNFDFTTKAGSACILTQGYWKNHEQNWAVMEVALGSRVYSQAELLSIFNEPVQGNGLISLAHQLIAAKLNISNSGDATVVINAIESADALIGDLVVPPVGSGYLSPSSTSGLTQILDNWNNQVTGSGICDTEICCLVERGVCYPTEVGTCSQIGGSVIPPDECDIFYECSVPTALEGVTWGTLKMRYR